MNIDYATGRIIRNTSYTMPRGSLFRGNQNFNGNRNYNESCGWPDDITIEQYWEKYDRQDIAKTVVSAYPQACWAPYPTISDDIEANETPFEASLSMLLDTVNLFSDMESLDRLCGIGEFGGMFLGVDDGKEFYQPVTTANNLLYTRSFYQKPLEILSLDSNTSSPRYGQPEYYNIDFTDTSSILSGTETKSGDNTKKKVHWTRIIHAAESKDTSIYLGTPRMKPLYNRLQDLEKLLGCSAEMFWQGAFQGLSLTTQPDTELTDADKQKVREEMTAFANGIQRFLTLRGFDVKTLQAQVADPKNHIDAQLMFISAVTRIPVRILIGSERGEMASTQDVAAWDKNVSNRRIRFCEPEILRPTIDRLIKFGILKAPKNGKYHIIWTDLKELSTKEFLENSEKRSKMLAEYVRNQVYTIYPPRLFFMNELNYSAEKADTIWKAAKEDYKEISELEGSIGEEESDDSEMAKREKYEDKERPSRAKGIEDKL